MLSVAFQAQLSSIMEGLTKAAVAEVSKLVEEGYAELRLQISRSHTENQTLKEELRRCGPGAQQASFQAPDGDYACNKHRHIQQRETSPLTCRTAEMGPAVEIKTEDVDISKEPLGADPVCLSGQKPSIFGVCDTIPTGETRVAFIHEETGETSNFGTNAERPQNTMFDGVKVKTFFEMQKSPGCSYAPKVILRDVFNQMDLPEDVKHSGNTTDPLVSPTEDSKDVIDASHTVTETQKVVICETVESFVVCHREYGKRKNEQNHARLVPCPVEVSNPPQGQSHQRGPEKKDCICKTCGKGYPNQSKLKIHKRVHTGEKPFTCTTCGKCFSQSRYLKVHERVHTGEKPYTCTYCGKSFPRSDCLKKHERVHTGEKPYSCTYCGKGFSYWVSLNIHKNEHTGEKPFTCSYCGKGFSQSINLKVHERVHTGEKPYSCTSCGKRFSHMSSLKVHKYVHTGEKAFSCTECNSSFSRSNDLRKHQGIHKGLRPVHCNVCGKSFMQVIYLRRHQRIHDKKS